MNDLNEKLKSFIEFLFKRDFEFEVKEKTLVLKVDKPLVEFVKLFSEKFKDIFNLELNIIEIEPKPEKHEHETEHEHHHH